MSQTSLPLTHNTALAPLPSKSRSSFNQQWTNYLFIVPIIILIALFFYYPIVYTAGLSTLDWNGISATRTSVELSNYVQIVTRDPIVRKALSNQFAFGVVTILGQMALGLTMAILLKSRARFKTVYKVIFFLPVVISTTVVAYVFRRIADGSTGELNALLETVGLAAFQHSWLADPKTALWVLMFANMWQWTGFSFMMYYSGLTQIDTELYEAARIDGAEFWEIIRHIVLPLLRATHFSLVILGVIGVLKTFDLIYLTTQGNPARSTEFMSTYIYKRGILEFDAGYGAALSMIVLVIAFLLTLIQLRGYGVNDKG